MQSTGLFESGDALRNVMLDLKLPIFALVGVRNALVAESRDSAKLFAEPMLKAWGIPYVWIRGSGDGRLLNEHFVDCRKSGRAGAALLAEGPP
jgi:hypothetical protein